MRKEYILGPVKGEFKKLLSYLKTLNLSNADIFQLGDFGIGTRDDFIFEGSELTELNNYLGKQNLRLFITRGAYDDKDFFDPLNVVYDFRYIRFIPDLTVMNNRILFIGGGTHYIRTEFEKNGVSKFSENGVVMDESVLMMQNLTNVDTLITYSIGNYEYHKWSDKYPGMLDETFFKNYPMKVNDDTIIVDLIRERKFIDKVITRLPSLKYHFIGCYINTGGMVISGYKTHTPCEFALIDVKDV